MRVLIVGRDRQFKRMARLLFERRGSLVLTGAETGAVVELVRRHGADVVILDVSHAVTPSMRVSASLAGMGIPVGIVLVGDGGERESESISVLPKWGPFEDLYAEAQRVYPRWRRTAWGEDVAL